MTESKILRISIFCILCFLIVGDGIVILSKVVQWLMLKTEASNDLLIALSCSILGLVIPLVTAKSFFSKNRFSPPHPNYSSIIRLLRLLILTTLLKEGSKIVLSTNDLISTSDQLKMMYSNIYPYVKILPYSLFPVTVFLYSIWKLLSLQKLGLNEQVKNLKIGIAGVMTYLAFVKFYALTTNALQWFYASTRIENELTIIILTILFGITSLLMLIFFYSVVLKNKLASKRGIVILVVLQLIFAILNIKNAEWFIRYLEEAREVLEFTFLHQFKWSAGLNYLFKYGAIAYFIWRISINEKQRPVDLGLDPSSQY